MVLTAVLTAASMWLRSGVHRAEALARGPFGGALGVTLAALVVVAGLALGLWWLRGDAARDAEVACDARAHAAALAAERTRSAAIEAALADAREQLRLRQEEATRRESELARLEHEGGLLREQARKADEAAGRGAGVLFRGDDAWLRSGAGAGAGASRGR